MRVTIADVKTLADAGPPSLRPCGLRVLPPPPLRCGSRYTKSRPRHGFCAHGTADRVDAAQTAWQRPPAQNALLRTAPWTCAAQHNCKTTVWHSTEKCLAPLQARDVERV